jgi:ADP-dependent NAD(P)H-hydrate dehydratase / NAD(P)H-hydrate epimerase
MNWKSTVTSTYWQKQTPDKPLFPELLWSRPEQKSAAGKLLIAGGNLHSFTVPAQAFSYAEAAGIGVARVLLPDAIKKLVGGVFESGEFAPSTPSGSFSQKALDELLEQTGWADGVLLAGDFGRNSETAILLEKFVSTYDGPLAATQDTLDYFTSLPGAVFDRADTIVIASFAQLQKLAAAAGSTTALTFDMDLLRCVEALHELSSAHQAGIIVKHLDQIIVAHRGRVSTTSLPKDLPIWRIKTAAYASVWQLQNPIKLFEALTVAVSEAIGQ